ncbi:hypothetical protein EJB05_16318, partial [Eragrostis curvula]
MPVRHGWLERHALVSEGMVSGCPFLRQVFLHGRVGEVGTATDHFGEGWKLSAIGASPPLDPKEHSSDPRFQLKKWAVLKDCGYNHDIKMVNLRTCRVFRKNIPQLYYYYFYAADGGWAEPNTEEVQEHSVRLPNYIVSMEQFAGDVYVADRYGSIISNADEGIVMTQTVGAAEDGPSYYLVESAGELLLVTRRRHNADVQKGAVDTVRKVLEPLTSIGRRAIFISQVKSFVVDTFPTIEAGCIYFVDADLDLDGMARHRIIASSFCLQDQTEEDIMESGKMGRRCGPPIILEVLIDYCRSTPTYEYELSYSEDDEDDDFEGY